MPSDMARERWTVGEYTVCSIVEEQSEAVPVEFLYREKSRADVRQHTWLVPDYADEKGRLRMRVQAFAIQGRGRTLLVDPCVGNQKRRLNPYWNMREWPFLERMAEAGLSCEAIDTVVHTHLHEDHLGWDTQLALITGDIVHNPVQCAELDWAAQFDADVDGARATRVRMLEAACKRGALVLGTHFANKPAGKVVAEGAAYRFVPL